MFKGLGLDQAPPQDIPFRFFLTAPFFLLVAAALIMFYGNDVFSNRWSLETLVLTHSMTLGWFSSIMMGAFYQMIPVMIGGSVPYLSMARFIHALFILGITAMWSGIFLYQNELTVIGLGITLFSILGFITQIAAALFKMTSLRPTVTAMRLSIISFLITLLFGVYLAGGHANLWELPIERAQVTGVHLSYGIVGWLGCLITGVSFHVIPMFYTTKDFPIATAHRIVRLIITTLLLLPIALWVSHPYLLLFLNLPAIIAGGILSYTWVQLIYQRKRKNSDVTLKFWQSGIVALTFSYAFYFALGREGDDLFSFLFLTFLLLGFAFFITCGMLYKIMSFLVWFHRYSPLIGIRTVPLLKEILPLHNILLQLKVHWLGLIILGIGIIGQYNLAVRLSGAIIAVSGVLILIIMRKIVAEHVNAQ
jgi:hypothetical protein